MSDMPPDPGDEQLQGLLDTAKWMFQLRTALVLGGFSEQDAMLIVTNCIVTMLSTAIQSG